MLNKALFERAYQSKNDLQILYPDFNEFYEKHKNNEEYKKLILKGNPLYAFNKN